MTTLTAVALGGNFMTAATWSPAQQPTAADDCVLAVTSGAVTLDAGSVCRSLSAVNYISTLTHTAGVTLTIGDSVAGAGNVALAFGAGMTYTLGNAATSAIAFVSTSATQQTVDSGGKTLGNVGVFSPGSASYLLAAAITLGATATLTLAQGTFATGNFAMSLGLFAITGGAAKTLTLGLSAIAITGAGTPWNVTGSNVTFTANTAVVTVTASNSGVSLGAFNYNGTSFVMNATGTPTLTGGGGTIANFTRVGTAVKGDWLPIASSFTVTGTLTLTGNSAVNRLLVYSTTIGTARIITAGAVNFTNVDFQDITAAGAAIPWTGTSMGNALGNTNITFDPSVTQTRNGAGGNYSDLARWTSRVPLPQDNVVIDSGSSGTITMDMPRLGADVTFAGFTGTASFVSVPSVLYGSLVLAAAMTLTTTMNFTLAARSAKTLTSAGKAFAGSLLIAAPGGTYTLVDALSGSVSGGVSLNNGTLDAATNNVNVTTGFYATSASTTTNMGTGTWSITGPSATVWNISATSTINASTSAIVYSVASASARTFAGGGKTYGTLTYTVPGSTGSLTITGANTFNTINFSDANNARSLLFTAGTTTTVTSWNVFGTAGKLMTVDSATAATHTLSKASGTASSDYLSVKNSLAGGGAYWYAGANSTNQGGNTGWRFIGGPQAQADTNFFFALAGAG